MVEVFLNPAACCVCSFESVLRREARGDVRCVKLDSRHMGGRARFLRISQKSFTDVSWERKDKTTRRERFLADLRGTVFMLFLQETYAHEQTNMVNAYMQISTKWNPCRSSGYSTPGMNRQGTRFLYSI
jgi:hypothetical protein